MAGESTRMKSVLFYGSVEPDSVNKVRRFLQLLTPRMLSRGYRIVTREGTNCPERYSRFWLDNLVLDVACPHRDQGNYPKDSVVSILMANDTQVSAHERTRRYISAFGRFEGYNELLNNCDAVIAIGGAEGVYRLGLFSASKDVIFVPFSFAGGVAKTLAREIHSLLVNYGPGFLSFVSQETDLGEQDVEQFLDVLDDAIDKQRTKLAQAGQVKEEQGITQMQVMEFLVRNDVPKLPIAVLLKVLPLKIVLAILTSLVLGTAGITWKVATHMTSRVQIDSSAQKQELPLPPTKQLGTAQGQSQRSGSK